MPRVLMLGPSIDAQGGMATVECNIIEAVKRSGDAIDFISTYEDAGKLRKLSIAGAAYARYLTKLGGATSSTSTWPQGAALTGSGCS